MAQLPWPPRQGESRYRPCFGYWLPPQPPRGPPESKSFSGEQGYTSGGLPATQARAPAPSLSSPFALCPKWPLDGTEAYIFVSVFSFFFFFSKQFWLSDFNVQRGHHDSVTFQTHIQAGALMGPFPAGPGTKQRFARELSSGSPRAAGLQVWYMSEAAAGRAWAHSSPAGVATSLTSLDAPTSSHHAPWAGQHPSPTARTPPRIQTQLAHSCRRSRLHISDSMRRHPHLMTALSFLRPRPKTPESS